MAVDVKERTKRTLEFETTAYVVKTNEKTLAKFHLKFRHLDREDYVARVKKMVADKMKSTQEEDILEVFVNDKAELTLAILNYIEDKVVERTNEELEDSIDVLETYAFNNMQKDEVK